MIWKFNSENPISSGNNLKITFTTNANFALATTGTRCQFTIAGSSPPPQTCTVVLSSATVLDITLTSCTSCPLAAGDILVYHYGINVLAGAGTSGGYSMKLQDTLNGKTICQSAASSGVLTYNNGAAKRWIQLSNLQLAFLTRRALGFMYFDFQVQDRIISRQERLLLNLGGVAKDN